MAERGGAVGDAVVAYPVGRVVGGRAEVRDDEWGEVRAVIRIDGDRFGPEALAGLAAFSHLEVVYHFDRVPEERIETGARHPRGNTDWPKVGIFAQRGKNRPNRIGVSRSGSSGWTDWTCRSRDSMPWTGRRCWTSSRTWRSSGPGAGPVSRSGRPPS